MTQSERLAILRLADRVLGETTNTVGIAYTNYKALNEAYVEMIVNMKNAISQFRGDIADEYARQRRLEAARRAKARTLKRTGTPHSGGG